jgi:hypothetical protein
LLDTQVAAAYVDKMSISPNHPQPYVAICGHPVSGSLVGVFWFEEHNEFLRSILVTPYLANLRRNSRYVYTKNYLTKALLRHRHRTIVVVVNKQPT